MAFKYGGSLLNAVIFYSLIIFFFFSFLIAPSQPDSVMGALRRLYRRKNQIKTRATRFLSLHLNDKRARAARAARAADVPPMASARVRGSRPMKGLCSRGTAQSNSSGEAQRALAAGRGTRRWGEPSGEPKSSNDSTEFGRTAEYHRRLRLRPPGLQP